MSPNESATSAHLSSRHRMARVLGITLLAVSVAGCFERPPDDASTSGGTSGGSETGGGSGDGETATSSTSNGPGETSAETSTGSSHDESTTAGTAMCGDGVVDPPEECDDGEATPTCSASCTACEVPEPMSVLDQELSFCVEGPFSDCRAGWSMSNGQSGLQGFRVDQQGALDVVQIYAMNDAVATTDITVQIVDGGTSPLFPVGATTPQLENSVVAEATAPGTTEFGWVSFDFAGQQLQLDPEHDYFIWVRMLPPFPADPDERIRWNLYASPEVADPYPGGRSFFCPAGQPCDTQLMHWDFAFRVNLLPAPPVCQ